MKALNTDCDKAASSTFKKASKTLKMYNMHRNGNTTSNPLPGSESTKKDFVPLSEAEIRGFGSLDEDSNGTMKCQGDSFFSSLHV